MLDIFDLARLVTDKRADKKNLEDELKKLNADLDECESRLIQAMADEELDGFKLEGRSYILTSRLYASPKAGQKDKVIEWFKSSDMSDIVQETINAQTLTATVKAMQEEMPLPEDLTALLNIYEKPGISIRKA